MRAATGVVLCGAPLLLLDVNRWLACILLAGFVLFALFLVRTALAPPDALRAGTGHALRRRTGRHAGGMEPARPHEAQLFLDQARPVGWLDAAQPSARPAAAWSRSIPRSRAFTISSSGRRRRPRRRASPLSEATRANLRSMGIVGGGSGRIGMKDLLRVENLTVEFGVHEGMLRAVDNVSFSIPPGGTRGAGGRVGLGQVGLQPGDHGPAAAHRDDRRRARSCSTIRASTRRVDRHRQARPHRPGRCARIRGGRSPSSSRSR